MNLDELYFRPIGQASLVSLVCPGPLGHPTLEETMRSLGELRELFKSLGMPAGTDYVQ